MSLGLSVCPPKNTKPYKTLQNLAIAIKTVKEASAACQSFLDGVVIFNPPNGTSLFGEVTVESFKSHQYAKSNLLFYNKSVKYSYLSILAVWIKIKFLGIYARVPQE